MQYCVYILTNTYNTVVYVGVTNNLARRIYEHKNKLVDGFTKRYNLNKLVYYEVTENIYSAISREKQIKNYSRARKNKMIDEFNPIWKDLYNDIV